MKNVKKLTTCLLVVCTVLLFTSCGRNNNVNDATDNNGTDNNNGVVKDIGEDVVDGVKDIGEDVVDGVEDIGDDLTGNEERANERDAERDAERNR